MECYEMAKQKGARHSNPDRKVSWRQWNVRSGNRNARVAHKKDLHVANRRALKDDIGGEEKFTLRIPNKMSQFHYGDKTKKNTLFERQVRRSGRYCLECENKYCEHRSFESAMLIVHSQRYQDGDFAIFPAEIAVMIARKVYNAQMALVHLIDRCGYIPPCLYREVYLGS